MYSRKRYSCRDISIGRDQVRTISENAVNGANVGDVIITTGDPTEFLILAGNDDGTFAVDNNGQITVADASQIDFATKSSYILSIQIRKNSAINQLSNIIANLNVAPTITGGATATISVVEGETAVGTIVATDANDGQTPRFLTILSGTDASSFSITTAGVLTFNTTPNFDTPGSVAGTNIYEVIVTATDGTLIDTQIITVIVLGRGTIVATETTANVIGNDIKASVVFQGITITSTLIGSAGNVEQITVFSEDTDFDDCEYKGVSNGIHRIVCDNDPFSSDFNDGEAGSTFELATVINSVSGFTATGGNSNTLATAGTITLSGGVDSTVVAQVVDFTPTAASAAGVLYRMTINGTDYDYTSVGADTVQTIVEALQPLVDANSAVTCTEDDTKVTCTADTAGTAFTFSVLPPSS
ncbi:hypothetical protein SPONL_2000 [uncultured Candidatus Thioglobus sp.]|nr:hypothetical protein SPONL_2000 [uncultured Candidatus Thioglobus sp.]